LETLDELGVDRAAERLGAYPHEFSGGMRQRVVLATALVGEPALLIADEPTTALDVRVQEQVLTVINEIAQRRGLAVILVTHDLGVVAGFADRVAVMYAGRIVEDSPVGHLFSSPQHPYTAKLLRAVPRVDIPLQRLVSIDGSPPSPAARPAGCPFHPRCEFQFARCQTERPELVATETRGVSVACHLVNRSED
jgi:oligopeptide/dipeptide ABC transporter ATP-binding protein